MSESSATTSATATVSKIADPAPLGLAALGMSLGLLSFHNSGLVGDAALVGVTGSVAVVFGGIFSVLTAIWEYVRGNTFNATFFGALGAYWITDWMSRGAATVGGDAHSALGLYYVGWALVGAYLTVAALKTSGVTLLTTGGLTATWLLLAFGQLQNGADPDTLTKIGGWLGLLTAAAAFYGSFAGVANETYEKQVLPTWPR